MQPKELLSILCRKPYMKKLGSIVYVNFAPYDNAGKILDYIIGNFALVIHFSFDFHKLNKKHSSNIIRIYKNGTLIDTRPFIRIQTPEALLFISLPFRSVLIAIITFLYLIIFKKKYGKFNYYFTVNAYTAWIGNMARNIGFVKKTIFWVWDYYPPGNSDWKMRIASFFYRRFDKITTATSDKIFFLSKRLETMRKIDGTLNQEKKYETIPIATDPRRNKTTRPHIIGHFGVLKKSQGLDFLFNSLSLLTKKKLPFRLEIIGSGPDEKYFKMQAKKFGKMVKFYGFIENENNLREIISNWRVGLALYMPGENNISFWTDPSKIKYYLSQGVSTITTNVVSFANEVKKYKTGIVVHYGDKKMLLKAIELVFLNYKKYGDNAYALAKKYDYSIIYPRFFK